MSVIYIDEQGAVLRVARRQLRVEKNNYPIASFPVAQIDRVVIVGNVQLSLPAIALFLRYSIPVSFITTTGRYRGELATPFNKNIFLRFSQYQRYHDKEFRLKLGREIISAKIKNRLTLLQRHRRSHIELALPEIGEIKSRLPLLHTADSIQGLMGIEGSCDRCFFSAFAKMIRKEFYFTHRTRRPPRDPVNSLLSFGYSLLYDEVFSALHSVGFDPYLGYLHGIKYGRPSLALDLIEEFRFLIDGFVLYLINNRILTKEDFVRLTSGSFYLKENARARFFKQYENRMSTMVSYGDSRLPYRRIIFRQAEHLAGVVSGKNPEYQGFLCK